MNQLPVSRIVNVSVTLTPAAAQGQNLSNLLILSDNTEIDVAERVRVYEDITDIAAQFGTSAPEYLAASLWFGQAPKPTTLLLGRWAKTASHGQLIGGTLSAANNVVGGWTGIANGSFAVATDGGGVVNVTALDFTAAASLNAVAAIIDAAYAGGTVIYDANYGRFKFTSATTGAASTVSFLTPAGVGTDIGAKLAGTLALGAYQAPGIIAESAVASVALFDSRFGQQFYATVVIGGTDADSLAVAAYVEASNNKHFQGVTSQDPNAPSSVATTDIGYLLKALGYKKTAAQYSSTNPYAVVSELARIMTTDYEGNNTVITLAFKGEPGVVAENLNSSQAAALEAKNYSYFAAFNNDTTVIQNPKVASGNFIDSIMTVDAFAVDLMTAVYNLLYTSPTKIPQTDAGMHVLATGMEAVCVQYVDNGFLAPGVWNSAGFGPLKQGDFMPKGYVIYAPTVASQNQSSRAARRSVQFQIAAKEAGAVHGADIAVTINQ